MSITACLWRMNRRRLDAESVHDAMLQAAGQLDTTMGGPSVRQFGSSPGVHVTPVVDYTDYDWDRPAPAGEASTGSCSGPFPIRSWTAWTRPTHRN